LTKTTAQYRDIHQEIIERCRQQDEKAQFELYDLYYQAMYNTALRLVNDSMEAEDIMQESFLDAFRKLDSFRGDSSFGAWLKRIVVNKSLNAIKRHSPMLDVEKVQVADEDATESSAVVSDYSVTEIKKTIAGLADGYRVILSLYLLEGYDHEEISGIMGISAGTSRSQYARARVRLKENLQRRCHAG